jgi:hypothetical protein
MTSVVQQHDQPAAPAELEPPALNGAEPPVTDSPGRVSFPELVWAHYKWRKAVGQGSVGAELERDYHRKLKSFEEEHGPIVNVYWCLKVPSAVALTAKPRHGALRLLGVRRPKLAFHRVTDWATRDAPSIATKLHHCDEMAIRADQVLTGVRKRIAMQMVMATASHLLSMADEKATKGDSSKLLEREGPDMRECETYFRNAANGQAQMVYFGGMGFFTLVLGLLSLLNGLLDPLTAVDAHQFFAALFAGALGALVSVVARINSGRFDLEDVDVGWAYPLFLGGLRPLIGGVFGVALYFALAGDLLKIVPQGADKFHAIVVFAFVAGFSERWAKDTLAVATGTKPSEEARPRGRGRRRRQGGRQV